MGTMIKRGEVFRAIVRTKGITKTKSFATKRAGLDWIADVEHELRHHIAATRNTSLGDLLTRYRKEIIEPRNHGRSLSCALKRFACEFDKIELTQCSADFWEKTAIAWNVSPVSCYNYLTTIHAGLKCAQELWNVTPDWRAMSQGIARLKRRGLYAPGASRDRRVTDAEIASIKLAMASTMPMSDIIDFAVATSMRIGEICRITWADFDAANKMQMVRDRKHPTKKKGNDKNVPLLNGADAIIARQPRSDARIFPFHTDGVGNAFRAACKRAGVKAIHFHDLRHEGISRLFEAGYGIPEVALVSGHDSWKCLKGYTNIKASSLHNGPIAQRVAA